MDKEKEFKAFVVEEINGGFIRTIQKRKIKDLPEGNLLIKVYYSSLNYKDALSATGNKGVTKVYPHTPGIDAVGVIEESKDKLFKKGDEVIVTSYDLGVSVSGGFAEYIRVPSSWAVHLPEGINMKESMAIGTAGLTAATSVYHLTQKVKKGTGPIIVSGASGGVGSMSIRILKKLGYEVVALSGKTMETEYLYQLGASKVISRLDFQVRNNRSLLSAKYAGGIDAVGGPVLENILKSVMPFGVVANCGNVASPSLNITVYPFIIRGVSLIGVSSQNLPMQERQMIWDLLSKDWKLNFESVISNEITLEELNPKIFEILEGRLKGRTVINLKR